MAVLSVTPSTSGPTAEKQMLAVTEKRTMKAMSPRTA
jgi:hypothetical protein